MRVVARAMRDYGMYNGDNSGRFKVYAQLLSPDDATSIQMWEDRFPGLAKDIEKIPIARFQVARTGSLYREGVGAVPDDDDPAPAPEASPGQ